jgi:hypothetical protein
MVQQHVPARRVIPGTVSSTRHGCDLQPAPAPSAGAPLSNGTQFCDMESCYVYRPAAASFGAARNSCLALGGDLVVYPSFDVQLRVERYFTKQLQLASYWWAPGLAWPAAGGRCSHAATATLGCMLWLGPHCYG